MVELFLKYLQFEKRVSAHTVVAYQTDLKQFLEFTDNTFRQQDPRTFDHNMIRSWIINLSEDGLDASSINRKIACLRTFYKFLLRQESIAKNPMAKVRVLKTKKKLPHFVKEQDLNRILDTPEVGEGTFEDKREQLVMELFYGTGIRLSELINLKESDVDFLNRTIKVLGKRNKERVIPFSSHLVSIIKDYQEMKRDFFNGLYPEMLLVTDKGQPCYPGMIQRIVKNRLASAHVDKKSPHVLRHSYATHLLDKGAEINAVKDLLGHSSLAATQVYTHNSMEKLKKAFDQAHPKA